MIRKLQFVVLCTALAGCPAMQADAQEALKLCRIIKNDTDRLKCFDGAVALMDAVIAGQGDQSGDKEWTIKEERSPLDDSPTVAATLKSADSKSMLIFRCREKMTDAYVLPNDFIYFGDTSVRVTYRIDQAATINGQWPPSSDGRAAFIPTPIPFIRALNDRGKLFVRTFDRKGVQHDALFDLANLSEVRSKISEACQWDVPPKVTPRAPAPAGPLNVIPGKGQKASPSPSPTSKSN